MQDNTEAGPQLPCCLRGGGASKWQRAVYTAASIAIGVLLLRDHHTHLINTLEPTRHCHRDATCHLSVDRKRQGPRSEKPVKGMLLALSMTEEENSHPDEMSLVVLGKMKATAAACLGPRVEHTSVLLSDHRCMLSVSRGQSHEPNWDVS